jgi:hypothetical protein
MLNEQTTAALKDHLKILHRRLAETGEVDVELETLLRQLDGDIRKLLDRQSDEELDANTYGVASRIRELSARIAARHPHLEPALMELGNMLTSMGI